MVIHINLYTFLGNKIFPFKTYIINKLSLEISYFKTSLEQQGKIY